ncbi:hypothetical protein BVRB_1g012040 [Beta vulgaris subsp. vulgaris]|nr:hypothetical protein BVRB_1g012040 [Beta vulgaris subsp. vulgaris]
MMSLGSKPLVALMSSHIETCLKDGSNDVEKKGELLSHDSRERVTGSGG